VKRRSILALLLLATVASSSCYGPFGLTKKVWKWNGDLGSKWASEGVFLVLNIVPVYQACVLVDAIVLNSVKFWTGKDALEMVRLEIYQKDLLVQTAVIRPDSDGSMQAYTLDGQKLVSRCAEDGMVQVTRADGSLVAAYPATAAERYLQ
jgi:hypothetical protein